MKPAAAYVRCSTDDQAGSLPAQRASIQEYGARNGFEIVEWFVDDGVSGTSLNRPGLNALISASADERAWRHILVWDRSRLGRPEDPREAIAVTYQIEKCGRTIVPLHGCQQTENPVINTILEALEFGQAGEESIRKSRDVLRGQKAAAAKGSIPNGAVPYGYDALYLLDGKPTKRVRYMGDRTKHFLSIDGLNVIGTITGTIGKANEEVLTLTPGDPDKVNIVRRIFAEATDGLSPRTIAGRLNAGGIPSPRGKRWARCTVLAIVRNPAYRGALVWNQFTSAKFHTARGGEIARTHNPTKKTVANPSDSWVERDNEWEGLVTTDQWQRANDRLRGKRPTAFRGRGMDSPYLASGLVRCAVCGSALHGCSNGDRTYYRCGGAEFGRGTCTSRRIRREMVDDYLERRIIDRYLEPGASEGFWFDIGAELDAALVTLDEPADTYADDRKRLADVEAQIDRLVGAVASGTLQPAEVEGRLNPLRTEKAALGAKLKDAGRTAPAKIDRGALRRRVLDSCKTELRREADLWPGATPEERKLIVRSHVAGIVADSEKCRLRVTFLPIVAAENWGIDARLS